MKRCVRWPSGVWRVLNVSTWRWRRKDACWGVSLERLGCFLKRAALQPDSVSVFASVSFVFFLNESDGRQRADVFIKDSLCFAMDVEVFGIKTITCVSICLVFPLPSLSPSLSFSQVSNWFANARRRLKNTVRQPDLSWALRIKLYNKYVQGNAERLSVSSDDSCSDGTARHLNSIFTLYFPFWVCVVKSGEFPTSPWSNLNYQHVQLPWSCRTSRSLCDRELVVN